MSLEIVLSRATKLREILGSFRAPEKNRHHVDQLADASFHAATKPHKDDLGGHPFVNHLQPAKDHYFQR